MQICRVDWCCRIGTKQNRDSLNTHYTSHAFSTGRARQHVFHETASHHEHPPQMMSAYKFIPIWRERDTGSHDEPHCRIYLGFYYRALHKIGCIRNAITENPDRKKRPGTVPCSNNATEHLCVPSHACQLKKKRNESHHVNVNVASTPVALVSSATSNEGRSNIPQMAATSC